MDTANPTSFLLLGRKDDVAVCAPKSYHWDSHEIGQGKRQNFGICIWPSRFHRLGLRLEPSVLTRLLTSFKAECKKQQIWKCGLMPTMSVPWMESVNISNYLSKDQLKVAAGLFESSKRVSLLTCWDAECTVARPRTGDTKARSTRWMRLGMPLETMYPNGQVLLR